jgi:cellulose synthase/poly-beta-1,6-N-acetylglucosamine synthase-like glycosyltransferase
VNYVSTAVFYDEQPISFKQSWNQRMRWGFGHVQVWRSYAMRLAKSAIFKRNRLSLDLLLTVIFPVLQPLSVIIGGASLGLMAYGVFKYEVLPLAIALIGAIAGPLMAVIISMAFAAFVVWLCRGNLRGTAHGIASFIFFQLAGIPIYAISLFKKDVKWVAIEHTKAVSLDELEN